MMKLSELIKRLSHIQRKVGDVPVFFGDDYDRIWNVGHAVLRRVDDRHIEWDEALVEGQTIVEVQE
jgi:hypothetical protein